jgi:adenine-specific DNA-methyltransferase
MTNTTADFSDDPIPRITRDMDDAGSGDVVMENVAALKAMFPSIVTDGQVDFDVLRQLLGDAVEDGEERYGLNWKGKRRARAFALTPTLATLRPAKSESKDWDSTRNIVIEGDNLEVLKCLRRSYAGQVKLIYIDPPYNTGNDFVYPDNYADSVGNYERLTGQRGDDGAAMTTNKEASGRFHTDWLNMIYPRLMLAKELLRDDGVIAVSLNDGEMPNARSLLNDLLGEQNFIGALVWKSRQNKDNRTTNGASIDHEYLLCYGTGIRGSERLEGSYSNPDGDRRGDWTSGNMVGLATPDRRPNLHYDLIDPNTGTNYGCPPLGWRYERATMDHLIREEAIIWPASLDGRPRRKAFLADVSNEYTGFSSVIGEDIYTRHGTADISDLFDIRVFDFPKPVALIRELLDQSIGRDDLVVDFFAGSGTTGHAVLAQNAADGGNRRYILVQLPEPLDPANANQKTAADFCDTQSVPRTIAELTKERLRRAGAKVAADNPDAAVDTGFRVYKLATSNLKPWQPDPDNLAQSLLDAVENILPDRTEDDLLVELLLKTGIDLTLPMQTRTVCQRAPNDLIAHALGGGVLIVCLGDVADADAEDLGQGIADWHAELDPIRATTFYFRDSGFTTAAAKANVAAIIRQRVGNRVEKLASI